MKLKHPLDPWTVEILRLFASEDVDCFLVGATARELLLHHVHGLERGRATRDVDFAVAVSDWQQYAALKERLLQGSSRMRDDPMPHRLWYQVAPAANAGESPLTYAIDIIPFAGVEDGSHQLRWPPDFAVQMNLSGFAEAGAHALDVEIEKGWRIKVASLPALALLKLLAWQERGASDRKDAQDLLSIIRSYESTQDRTRVYEDRYIAVLEALDWEVSRAWIWMLGHDMRWLASGDTLAQVLEILQEEESRERLLSAWFRGFPDEAKLLRMLELVKAGLTDASI